MSENQKVPPNAGMPPGPPALPENWPAMTADEKFQFLASGLVSIEGKPFVSPEIAEKYQARARRWLDAVALKEPDRVPCFLSPSGFVRENAGILPVDQFYNPEIATQAFIKFHEDFDYDYSAIGLVMSGRALDLLGYRLIRWPGSALPTALSEKVSFQYVEDEYMRADEYDQLIANPDGYMTRTFLPRICGGLKGLEIMPSLYNAVEVVGITPMLMSLASGPLRETIDTLLKAADQTLTEMTAYRATGLEIMRRFGTPSLIGGMTFAPFDIIGDTMRGTRGVMLDMYRNPDKLMAACEALVPASVQMAVQAVMRTRNPFVMIPLHKGADGFMSDEQFARFYWPTFRAQLLGLIEAGLIPLPFVEGGYDRRLDVIAESGLPAGKTVWLFDRTSMKAAKEKFGGFACIGGNVPASLFATGTPEMMESYCKELIDMAAPGGGFFLAPGAVIDQAKPENMAAYLNATKKFGVY
ncbi:MAG: uroporphyrinogen decarboxylase family protein [Pseudomonadota bacterium]